MSASLESVVSEAFFFFPGWLSCPRDTMFINCRSGEGTGSATGVVLGPYWAASCLEPGGRGSALHRSPPPRSCCFQHHFSHISSSSCGVERVEDQRLQVEVQVAQEAGEPRGFLSEQAPLSLRHLGPAAPPGLLAARRHQHLPLPLASAFLPLASCSSLG